jgi:hypothetical protein
LVEGAIAPKDPKGKPINMIAVINLTPTAKSNLLGNPDWAGIG